MNAKILIAGVAVAALTAVSAQAASTHNAGAYAEPSQPIAYSNVGPYLKASPKARQARDWSGGSAAAAGNAGSNVSATTPPAPAAGSMPMSTHTQSPDANVSDTPPTVSPQVDSAATQPPLNSNPGMDNSQPPASNAPATTDQAGPTTAQ
jgi:hypothetical protein